MDILIIFWHNIAKIILQIIDLFLVSFLDFDKLIARLLLFNLCDFRFILGLQINFFYFLKLNSEFSHSGTQNLNLSFGLII